jgi:hypothetical protein
LRHCQHLLLAAAERRAGIATLGRDLRKIGQRFLDARSALPAPEIIGGEQQIIGH